MIYNRIFSVLTKCKVTLLRIPEVRADMICELASLDIYNLLHLNRKV
jgi:hypothetical protein